MADVGADRGRTARPTWAFMLAPSMYTCPPCSWTIAQIVRMSSSKTPWVEGISDHQAGEPPIPVFGGLRSKVAHVHAAVRG